MTVRKKLFLIEFEGLLYRGPAPSHPTEIWDYPRGGWVPFKDAGTRHEGWGKAINSTRAATLKKDNPHAEHFLYYDTPPWSQPLSESYYAAVRPDHLTRLLERKGAGRGKP